MAKSPEQIGAWWGFFFVFQIHRNTTLLKVITKRHKGTKEAVINC